MKRILSFALAAAMTDVYKRQACTNSCGTAGETKNAGYSAVYDPWGELVGGCGPNEMILTTDMDLNIIKGIRSSINVYRVRQPGLYQVN